MILKQQHKSIIKKSEDLVKDLLDNNDYDLKTNPTFWLGSVLVLLSGFLLFLDKFLGKLHINFEVPTRYAELGWDFNTLIWFFAQTICPLLLIAGVYFKAHKLAYFSPLYFYTVQLYMVLFDFKIIDNQHYYIYSFVSVLLLIAIYFIIKKLVYLDLRKSIDKRKKDLLNNE